MDTIDLQLFPKTSTRNWPQSSLAWLMGGLSAVAVLSLVVVVLTFLGAVGFAIFTNYQTYHSFFSPAFTANNIVHLLLVGVFFAFLSALLAWPFALATATILVYEYQHWWSRAAVQFFRGLTFLPSLVFSFVFCWSLGPFLQNSMQESWLYFFRAEGIAAQIIAFAFTILVYPLSIFAPKENYTVDLFFHQSLVTVVELAQGSFSALVIILSLAFLLLPTFVILLYRILITSKNDSFLEAARSLGATEWEAMTMAIVHAMRQRFASVFLFGILKAFVEGISIFVVLNYFFLAGNWHKFFWAETFSAFLIKALLFHNLGWADYIYCAGILFVLHAIVSYWYRSLILLPDEELMR